MLKVRGELTRWLPHVIQFFPHYPSHGLDHSDRIVEQLSHLLFKSNKPAVKFSDAEVYCLLCAAYLHDMGMVVSPSNAQEILASEKWAEFVSGTGKGHQANLKYEEAKAAAEDSKKNIDEFRAAQLLRQLIAEFVRHDHHLRGKATLSLLPFLKQVVDHGDSVAFETISDLGVGHGLWDNEIANSDRFPEQRIVLGSQVNVRFLARLLRIGDLLDLSSERADPLSARAVGPLPSSARPHWLQYSHEKHANVTPDKIEFTFECEDQDTHRILRDWLDWLESEVRTTGLEQVHAVRHAEWRPPMCKVSSLASAADTKKPEGTTIIIKPAAGAEYTFHDWKLELDHEMVLHRLIYDVYDGPKVFIRELIQNALDATRCQMYQDFERQNPGVDPPDRPTRFPADVREKYPVEVGLTYEDVLLTPDGPTENRPVFTIRDHGTGMDENIIKRYFLQIGRSYYQSQEFRERFQFAPMSRFGVGFLSVFAVSNDITVDTTRRNELSGRVEGVRLKLHEPKGYLITQPLRPSGVEQFSQTGTTIRVVLEDWDFEETLLELVEDWCVAVEFPVIVDDGDRTTFVKARKFVDGTVLSTRSDGDAAFILRVFEVNEDGMEGQLIIIEYCDRLGEGWCHCWHDEDGIDGRRLLPFPRLPADEISFHGISVSDDFFVRGSGQWKIFLDMRSASGTVPLARNNSCNLEDLAESIADGMARKLIIMHFEDTPRIAAIDGIYYRGRVLSEAPTTLEWNREFPKTIPTWNQGVRQDLSLSDFEQLESISMIYWLERPVTDAAHPSSSLKLENAVSVADIPTFALDSAFDKIRRMNLSSVDFDSNILSLKFNQESQKHGYWCNEREIQFVLPFEFNSDVMHMPLRHGNLIVFNSVHPTVSWALRISEESTLDFPAVSPDIITALWDGLRAYSPNAILKKWDISSDIPEGSKPPRNKNGQMLQLRKSVLQSFRTIAGE